MQKTNRQLLIALFSAFCLVWLSAVNAVQASNELPNHPTTPDVLASTSLSDIDCPESERSDPLNHHAKVEHQNCSSVCVMKMPFEPVHYALQLAPSSIALIGQDNIDKAVSRIQTLFRPPIQSSLIDSLRA
ncbi:MAG TPA: hypothetical protein DCS35_12075 [Vibrio sp.]|nr:hypothetical protein [Vibrio sp.]